MPSKSKARRSPIKPSSYPFAPLVTLDVSSNAVGVAWFGARGELRAFDVITPRHGVEPHRRIDEIVRRVLILAGEPPCSTDHQFLIEWASGRVHAYQQQTSSPGTGLLTLGQAQGAVRQAVFMATGRKPMLVEDVAWTLRVNKKIRANRIAMEFPDYAAFRRAKKDPGLDAADAVGMGLWYFARAREQELQERLSKGA